MIFTVRQVSFRRIASTLTHFIRDGVDPRTSVDMTVSRNTYYFPFRESISPAASDVGQLADSFYSVTCYFLCRMLASCDLTQMLRHTSVYVTYFKTSVDKKNQLDVTFCILYFSSNSCSTCFGQPCAHHQELTTA